MAGHRKRFERWRNKLPERARFLVDQVLARIVPEFEAKGFQWYDDFAGGNTKEIGHNEIPLQRREGGKRGLSTVIELAGSERQYGVHLG